MRSREWGYLFLLIGPALYLSGCADAPTTEPAHNSAESPSDEMASSEADASQSGATVNTICPMMFQEVSPDAGTVEWDGKTVGFCCPGCDKKFLALDDAEKEAALAKAAEIAKAPAEEESDSSAVPE